MSELDFFPDVETAKPKVDGVNDQSFYAAASYSETPVEDFKKMKYEFSTQGESRLYELAQQKWMQEQSASNESLIADIAQDQSIPIDQKKAIFETYALTGFVSKDLRDKYIQKTAAKDLAITELDRVAQDVYSASVVQRDQSIRAQEAVQAVKEADIDFGAVLKGVSATAANIGMSIPAGLAGLYSLIKDRDAAKATEIIEEVQRYAYAPDDAGAQRVQQKIARVAEILDIPFQWIGDKVLNITGSPGAATVAYTGTSMVGYIGGAKLLGKAATKVKPTSPLGTTATANTKAAQVAASNSVAESSGELAHAFGTTRGDIVGDWQLPKLDEQFGDLVPDVREYLTRLDKQAQGLYEETQFDPSLVQVSKHMEDREKIIQTIKEVKGPYYQQANSVFSETADKLSGSSLFGRNETFGYDTRLSAEYALEEVKQASKYLDENWKVAEPTIVEKNGQFYIKFDWEKTGYKINELAFGPDAVSAKFLGINMDKIARSKIGEWIFPSNMRLDPWVTQTPALAALKTARVEKAFLDEIRTNVVNTKHKVELAGLIKETDDTGKVFTAHDVITRHPELSKQAAEDLHKSYATYMRMSDYMYWFSDRKYRSDLATNKMEAIYDQDGNRLGFGSTEIPKDLKINEVYDFEIKAGRRYESDTKGKQLVRLEDPIETEAGLFEFALVGGKTNFGPTPPGVLTKIPGYVPRKNVEFYYIDKYPKEKTINGLKVTDPDKLRNYNKTIAAASSAKEAKLLQERFQQEYPDEVVQWRKERGDIEQSIITDHKVYRDVYQHSQKRGDRLPTADGLAKLEDPVVALGDSIKSIARLDAWKDYSASFENAWMNRYRSFTQGEFPRVLTDIKPKKGMTDAEVAEFKNAQRLFEYYTNMHYRRLLGDEAWKYAFYSVSDILEKINIPTTSLRKMGLAGNELVRVPKAMASHMMLYLNPARQWLVQPQKFTELITISPTYGMKAIRQAPAIFAGVLGRAKSMESLRPIYDNVAAKLGGMSEKEYTAIIDAIHKTGIPQSIDLNMVIHGVFHDANSALVKTLPEKVAASSKTVVSLPGEVGKTIGYSPAELLNQVTIWLFAKDRWQKANPGKDWNTPENIAKISGESWDIADAMTTRAGALPYQDGALSLLFQFAAIQHKSFMQLFSSKVLSGTERARLAGARMLWYGVYGVAGSSAVDYLFSTYLPEESKESWNYWKRGMHDWITNGMANAMLEEGEVPTDLAVSKSLSPMPETVPYWDFMVEINKMLGEGEGSPRFPFVHAVGSLWEASRDVFNMFYATKDDEFQDPALLNKAVNEAFEMASGWNNYMKAQLILDTGTLLTKRGMPLGVAMNYQEAAARMWGGIGTYKEEVMYKAMASSKDRKMYIQQSADQIHKDLMNLRVKLGQEDFVSYSNRLNRLLNLYSPEMRTELLSAVLAKDKQSLLSIKESLLLDIWKHYKKDNDKYTQEMIDYLQSSKDPQTQELLRILKQEGMI